MSYFDMKKNEEGGYGMPDLKLPKNLPQMIIGGVVVILIIAFVVSGYYTVGPDQEGVVMRLGKYNTTTGPGLHFKIPFGIDRVMKISTRNVHKEEFGFRTRTPGIRTTYSARGYDDESIMLTGDLNVADVEWVVQFKIKDPKHFIFKVRDNQNNLRDMSESVMRTVVGDKSVNEVLTVGRLEIESEVQTKLQGILDKFKTGIQIVAVQLQNVNPAEKVKASYNEVNEAKQQKERMINEANKEYNKIIPKAKGQAKQMIERALGYKLDRVNKAKGDANKFLEIWKAYRNAKDVTRRRMYLETINEILAKADNVFLIDKDVKSVLPILNLDKELGTTKKEVANEE